jgi:type 1 fimbria pilin
MTLTFDASLAIDGSPLELTGGTQTLNLGGSLALAANQTAGAYSAEFNVTVAYE